MPCDLTELGRKIRAKVLKHTGIPVGVGIAHTKTLAKLANHTAKRLQAQTGGVVDLCDPFKRDWVLRNTAGEEVWGICQRMTAHMQALGIRTAMDLAKADPLCSAANSASSWRKLCTSSPAHRAWPWKRRHRPSRKSAAAACLACAWRRSSRSKRRWLSQRN